MVKLTIQSGTMAQIKQSKITPAIKLPAKPKKILNKINMSKEKAKIIIINSPIKKK